MVRGRGLEKAGTDSRQAYGPVYRFEKICANATKTD